MLVWGLRKRDRVFQYPFLAAFAWMGYLFPQMIGVVRNPRHVPKAVLDDGGLELALLMHVLCAAMGFVGYLRKPTARFLSQPPAHYNDDRLFLGGVILLIASLCGFHGLAQLTGGYIAFFSTKGNYLLEYSGLPVVFNLLKNLGYPALALLLLSTFRRPAAHKWIVVGLACVLPIATIVFLGRRSHVGHFMAIWAICIFLTRYWAPPQWMVIPTMVAMVFVVILAPEYRAHSQTDSDWSKQKDIRPAETFEGIISGESRTEFAGATVIMATYNKEASFGYGTGLYDAIVAGYVPRLLVGDEFKNSLFFNWGPKAGATKRVYGWKRDFASASSGACDAFRQFWLLGALLFYFIGVGYRLLWTRAVIQRSVGAQIIYLAMAPIAVLSITSQVATVVQALVFVAIFLVPFLWFAQRPAAPYHPMPRERMPLAREGN